MGSSGAVTVIDIIARVSDETEKGTSSATSNVTKLEKKMKDLANQISGMKGKSKIEVAASLKDMASKGLQSIATKGKQIAGKVWTVTLKAVDLVTAPFKKIWGLISSPITQVAAMAGISVGLSDTVNTFKEFEAAMSKVKAISGATGADFDALTAKAKEMGATTVFTASQTAEAFNYMAMAGWKTEDMLNGIEGILNLSAASGADLGTTSDIVTDALTAFGLKASDAGRFADVLAVASANANTNVEMMGETFTYVGSVAGAFGYGIEDVAEGIGLMANAGIKSSQAGTALRSIMTRLATDAGASSKKLGALGTLTQKLGVQFYDSTGKTRNFIDVIDDARKAWGGLTDAEKANYAKTIAGQNALAGWDALMNASETDVNKLKSAIENCNGAAEEMAEGMRDNLSGSLTLLSSAVDGVKISFGERLAPYVRGIADMITEHMPMVEQALDGLMNWVDQKAEILKKKVSEMTATDEWQNADIFGKIKIAWDTIIAEPFDEWWDGTGKTWLAGKAEEIGKGLGTALNMGIMALLGIDIGGAATDGVSIGKSFAEGFSEGFDGEKVGAALKEAILSGMKGLFSDAATLLPGGKEASATAPLSAGLLAVGGAKVAKTGYNIFKGGRAIYRGGKAVANAVGGATGISEGIQIAKAAKTGGEAAKSAAVFAESGALGTGVKIGATAGKTGAKAAPIIGGILGLLDMGIDAFKGTKKAGEWTGKDTTGAKVASGIGAAIGGTGGGIFSDESAGKKTLDIVGNAGKGAGIGGAIGAGVGALAGGVGAVPGAAIGAAIGGGVEALTGAIGGSNISKGLNTAGEAIGKFFTETVPTEAKKFGESAKTFITKSVPEAVSAAGTQIKTFFSGIGEKVGEFGKKIGDFFTQTIPEAASAAGEKLTGFFTETIPGKFDEFKEGLVSLFSEQIPYALGFATGKLEVFFTETVPEKWEEFTTGITDFFTQTIPAAMEAVGETLTTFFTETVPEFFGNLWDGIVGFFTQTLPGAIQAVGTTVTNFFTQTVPQFFTNLWQGITNFFTQTVAPAIQTVGTAVSTFFTQTIPDFFKRLWDGVTTFFTTTVPQAIQTVTSVASTFFTQTIPTKIEEIWDGITNFITTKIPEAVSAAAEAVSGFFEEIKNSITGFFSDLKESVTGFFSKAKSSFSAGHSAATGHAEGGIMTKPHIGLVGEDGPEAIVPLSSKRKGRGIALWQEAGKRLGVLPHAEGGIFGDEPSPPEPPEPIPQTGGGGGSNNVTISVNVNMAPAFTLNGNGAGSDDAMMDMIERHIGEISESAAWEIAQRLRQIFPNMPMTEVG